MNTRERNNVRAADKVLARADIPARLASIREGGGKIVFTCGVFDLLHVGHVRYLEFARSLGAVLVVGVNSDSSVRQLNKGSQRPLVPEADRAELVAALACVDYVFTFNELRPNESIRVVRPDIHVKDAAYEKMELPEAATVREVGGVVAFAPHVEGRSTSALLDRITTAKP
jgi:rfaE bifunctional protein nucleotidyltransferase chain/domain